MSGSGLLSDRVLDVAAAADPVAAFLRAHSAGRRVALRTSGSTGTARAVVRTTASWFDSFEHVAALTRLTAGSRVWLPGPLASTMNLFAAVLARHLGAEVTETPRIATHAHLTPHALRRALEDGLPVEGLHVTVAGDRLPPALHDRAVAAGAEVSHYYGAAELSFVAWGHHAEALRPFPGVEVEARQGELWVRSPYLCSGYLGPPGPLREDEAGFMTVGDRGELSGGRLAVAGRGATAVTTGGATVQVADVERVLTDAVAGDVVVVGLPHGTLGEVVTAVLTDAGDYAEAQAAARTGLAPAQQPRWWFHLPRLPVTPGGKVDRAGLVPLLTDPGAVRLTGASRRRRDR